MKEQMNKVIDYLKSQKLKGCVTGSCMLEQHFEGSDVDFFAYNKQSFTQIFYAMWHDPMFQILDKMELWKAEKFMNQESDFYKIGVQTIKFTYNTCIDVNIILKKGASDIFSVLSSFDMDIISIGFDTYLGRELDLSGDSHTTKTASWNKWNPKFYNPELWEVSRILRQLERAFKYYNRGYNTDELIKKYIELINGVQKAQDIFNSDSFSEKLAIRKANTKIVKQICEVWLETHKISEAELELLKIKIREI